ncbi:hypothetical protein VNO77_46805 [Canavalia gladiata]|uniref:Uncharacterized protein n=1 Tax=Canavalia gladiata TaxID=3824 RepID=A0AAN9JFT1_CANGL
MVPASPASATLAFVPACFHMGFPLLPFLLALAPAVTSRSENGAPMRAAPISTEARKTPFDQEETIPN